MTESYISKTESNKIKRNKTKVNKILKASSISQEDYSFLQKHLDYIDITMTQKVWDAATDFERTEMIQAFGPSLIKKKILK